MKEAPPILGPLDFAGMENQIVLIEHDEDQDLELLSHCFPKNLILSLSPDGVQFEFKDCEKSVTILTDSIAKAVKLIRVAQGNADFFIIRRIDMMDLNYDKKNRGAQVVSFISMLNERNLLGSNVIITTAKQEYSLREIVNRNINLRK